jgi:hypothetical protein
MKNITLILLLIALSLIVSCERIKKKGEHVVDKVEGKAKNILERQTRNIAEKVFPPFDSSKPDTENNKIRFKDFIQVDLTADVKNIYCFDDAIGIDSDYMFSFNCSPITSRKIVEKHYLYVDTLNKDNGFFMQHDFEWWDKKRIEQLQKYSWTDGKKYHKYYCYDAEAQKAYFFDFDL